MCTVVNEFNMLSKYQLYKHEKLYIVQSHLHILGFEALHPAANTFLASIYDFAKKSRIKYANITTEESIPVLCINIPKAEDKANDVVAAFTYLKKVSKII